MDCKKFEENIYAYFTDSDFDWRLRHEMEDHYHKCDKCYESFQLTKDLVSPQVRKGTARELAKDYLKDAQALQKEGKIKEALDLPREAQDLNLGDFGEEILMAEMKLLRELKKADVQSEDHKKELAKLKKQMEKAMKDKRARKGSSILKDYSALIEKLLGKEKG